MGQPVVHFEIGCRDQGKTAEFFKNLFGWQMQPMGPASMIDTASQFGITLDRFAETQWSGSHIRLYRRNGGAAADYGAEIRQERTTFAGGEALVQAFPEAGREDSLSELP